MRISTQSDVTAEIFGGIECISRLKEAGYDAIDWSFFEMSSGRGKFLQPDWSDYAKALRAEGDRLGIAFNQAHAPFPSSAGQPSEDEIILSAIRRSMEVASILGVRNIIVHPKQHLVYAKNKQATFDMNVEFYRALIPDCERLNILICAENMWQWDDKREIIVDSICAQPEEFCALLDAIDSPWIVGCLDIGHSALVGVEPADFIRALGSKRLQALHVHDVDYRKDCHTMPFIERIDWENTMKALAEIGYEGDLTLEADNYLRLFPKELQTAACRMMAQTAGYLRSRFEAYSAQ